MIFIWLRCIFQYFFAFHFYICDFQCLGRGGSAWITRATIHYSMCLESPFPRLSTPNAPLILALLSLLMLCVVNFYCPACFFLLYYALGLIFWFSFSFILRSVDVFMRVWSQSALLCIQCVFFAFWCLFFVILGCFLCFNVLHWHLIRWIAVCQASVYVSCGLLCFRVTLLSGDFYMAPVFFPVFLCFSLLYMYFAMSWKWRRCLNRACFNSVWFCPDSTVPRLWTPVAPVILAVLSMMVHVCCRFLLLRLLFIYLLCTIIDILAFFPFDSSFCRCFYESECIQRVFFCNHVCISRLVAFFVCFFDSFCSL